MGSPASPPSGIRSELLQVLGLAAVLTLLLGGACGMIFLPAIARGLGGAAGSAAPAPPAALSVPSMASTQSPVPDPTATSTAVAVAATEEGALPTEALNPVLRGKSLAARNGCAVCHSADGSPLVGPTWKGLFGSEETLADGSTVVVDEAYLRESILDPEAKLTRGYPPSVMPPDFAEKLSDDDIEAILAYIQSLK